MNFRFAFVVDCALFHFMFGPLVISLVFESLSDFCLYPTFSKLLTLSLSPQPISFDSFKYYPSLKSSIG